MALLLWIYWLSPLDEVAPVSEWCGSIFTGQGGSATPEYSTRFKYIFHHETNIDNKPKYNKRFKRKMNYRDMMSILFDRFPDLKAAYELKEKYILFNETTTRETVEELLPSILMDFANCNIPEYEEFYNLLRHWYNEIINSFNIANNKRINNSYIESRNRQIERLLFNANGYTNFKRARNRMMYCLNKDDTYKI